MLDVKRLRELYGSLEGGPVWLLCDEVDRLKAELDTKEAAIQVSVIDPLLEKIDQLKEACQAVVDVAMYTDPLSIEVEVIRTRQLCVDALAKGEN